jgi:hypothetical protein
VEREAGLRTRTLAYPPELARLGQRSLIDPQEVERVIKVLTAGPFSPT